MDRIWDEKKLPVVEHLSSQLNEGLFSFCEQEGTVRMEHQFSKWKRLNQDKQSARAEMDTIRRKKNEENFSIINKVVLYYIDLHIKEDGSWEENE